MYKIKSIIIIIFSIILYLITLFFTAENIVINILDLKNKNTYQGIVNKVYYSEFGGNSTGGNWNYSTTRENQTYHGEYNDRKNFGISVGDTITYKRRDFRNHIITLKINGKKIRNYYGMWEMVTLITFFILTFGFYYYLKILKKNRIQKHKEVSEKKFDYGDLLNNV